MKTNFDVALYELQAEISKTLAHPLRIAILHYLGSMQVLRRSFPQTATFYPHCGARRTA